MKAFLSIATVLMAVTDARFVSRASRDRVRHIRRRMEKEYGLGFVDLVDPIS